MFSALEPSQLTFADNLATKKYHIVRLERTAYDDDVSSLSKHLTKAHRAAKIAEINVKRKLLWNATALCGVRGEHTAWGNGHRYYWNPVRNPIPDSVCSGCNREWRRLDEPEIAGWDRTATHDEAWPWELPFGWREVPVEGHPWDVAQDDDVASVRDATGDVVGEHRMEIRRFMRGGRIVRITYHTDKNMYFARIWRVGAEPHEEKRHGGGTLQHVRQLCHKLMATGGY